MSTTPDQLRLIMEAIAEFMKSRGHDVIVDEHGVGLSSGVVRAILIREFKGSKWQCHGRHNEQPIDLVEPDSLEKLEQIILYCGQLDRKCYNCPTFKT